MSALCGQGMLCGVHSFVHNFVRSGSGVEFAVKSVLNRFDLAVGFRVVFAVKFVLNRFDLASRIKNRSPASNFFRCLQHF